ncbi:hypothetical protein [Streptomyces sp. NBC_01506]|uniref:hypothetical protein n=1 Tax=Streptomyces sp. NBC_01506 TaxID=2903887 RepID=UPI003869143E
MTGGISGPPRIDRAAVDDGPVELCRSGGEWERLPVVGAPRDAGRGAGLARHVLDTTQTLPDAARDGVRLPVHGGCARPQAVRP